MSDLQKAGGVETKQNAGGALFDVGVIKKFIDSVCRVKLPVGSGSGFLFDGKALFPDRPQRCVMTNNHVLPSAEEAKRSRAEFRFETDGATLIATFTPEEWFWTDEKLDVTVCAVEFQQNDHVPTPIILERIQAKARNDRFVLFRCLFRCFSIDYHIVAQNG